MAISQNTFNDFGGAASDLFSSSLGAEGTRIKASGLRISADALRLKSQGDLVEAGNYDLASGLASVNKAFTEESTAIKQHMADRQIYLGLGQEGSEIAGAGFANSGSALDLLRSSAQQGALQKELIAKQGLITEAGYQEQATSYESLAKYARFASGSDLESANATDNLANQTDSLANKTQLYGEISAGIKTAAGIATLLP